VIPVCPRLIASTLASHPMQRPGRSRTNASREEKPSQQEGQLDDDADYQTAYQSARTAAVNGGRGRPSAALRAGPPHRPTVDGMEEVRGSSPLSSTAKVLVRIFLILKMHNCYYAAERHLWS
jgi:hypothetical protein